MIEIMDGRSNEEKRNTDGIQPVWANGNAPHKGLICRGKRHIGKTLHLTEKVIQGSLAWLRKE